VRASAQILHLSHRLILRGQARVVGADENGLIIRYIGGGARVRTVLVLHRTAPRCARIDYFNLNLMWCRGVVTRKGTNTRLL
jgi:hypothetical protein